MSKPLIDYLSINRFEKRHSCPSAETILAHISNERAEVARHVACCDFCAAEMQMLAAHPPYDELTDCFADAPVEIPESLRKLAAEILINRKRCAVREFATD